jgi:hypothetical protein
MKHNLKVHHLCVVIICMLPSGVFSNASFLKSNMVNNGGALQEDRVVEILQ